MPVVSVIAPLKRLAGQTDAAGEVVAIAFPTTQAVRRQRAGRALQRKPAFKFRLFCGREAKERGILREEVD
jgi:hypothetical protein